VTKLLYLPIVVLIVIATAAVSITAQTTPGQNSPASQQTAASNFAAAPNAIPTTSPAIQGVIASLSNLPEADMLIYINPPRILNEALPKILPAKDIEGMRKGFEELKKNAGVDATRIDYIVLVVRFKKPTADLQFQAPDYMVVASGDFSAESLLGMARSASQGKLRDEKYGTKTLGLMTIDPIAKESEKNPFLKAYTEVGLVSLNGNTLAAGTPGYLRAAIDASEGKERIRTEVLNSLVRDPEALISFAAKPWHAFAKSFGMLGTEANARVPRCETDMGDFYGSLTMDATNFTIRGVSNADNPDTAKIIANLYAGLLRYAASSIPDPAAKALLTGLAITAEGDEVLVRAAYSQQMLIDLIQQHMKPKTVVSAAPPETQPVTRPAAKKRRTRRRG
jgi:hypothetical protein